MLRSPKVRILGVGQRRGSMVEAGVFCECGPLRVGQHLTNLLSSSGDELAVDFEVLEIRFFDQMVDELDGIFSGNVLFLEHRAGPIDEGAILTP